MTTQNIYDLVDTWTAGATTFTAVKMNVTNTASAASSRLIDLQIDTASRFNVSKDGYLNLKGTLAEINIGYLTETNLLLQQGGPILAGNGALSWSSSNTAVSGGNRDLILTRRGIANLRLGAADTTGTTAPTPQFLSAQSWSSSTTFNQTGANFTIDGSQGTGTGAGGSIIFRVAPAGGTSNGVQNGLTNILELKTNTTIKVYNNIELTASNAGLYNASANLTLGDASDSYAVTISGAANTGVTLKSTGVLRWTNGTSYAGTADLFLYRDATATLALRNGGTNASPVSQQFNVYKFWVSSTDYSRLEVGNSADAATHYLYATQSGTGTARDLLIGTSGAKDLLIYTNSSLKWTVNSSGHFLAGTDNTYDIGASGATRPRNVYAGTSITPGAGVVVASLPTPSTGMIARVTNALAPATGATVVGDGAAQALVWYNGANWTVIGV